jgi:hypothetical protein
MYFTSKILYSKLLESNWYKQISMQLNNRKLCNVLKKATREIQARGVSRFNQVCVKIQLEVLHNKR